MLYRVKNSYSAKGLLVRYLGPGDPNCGYQAFDGVVEGNYQHISPDYQNGYRTNRWVQDFFEPVEEPAAIEWD